MQRAIPRRDQQCVQETPSNIATLSKFPARTIARAGSSFSTVTPNTIRVVPPWDGTLGLSSRRKRRAFMCPLGLTLAPAECWSHLQTVDESPVIKYLAPIRAVTPNAAPETAIQHVVPASAVNLYIACSSFQMCGFNT